MILSNNNIGDFVLSRNIDDYPEGIILPVYKPYRWTSADVIRKIKFCACRHFRKKNLKVGHAGTLDPLATGVLLVCIGKATKQAEELQRHEKEYVAGVSFGATTPSYDLEKEIDMRYPTDEVTEAGLRAVLPDFLGEQEQVAPLFSAKSIDGVRAYELARREWKRMSKADSPDGAHFDHSAAEILNKQLINISEIELLGFYPDGLSGVAADEPAGAMSGGIPGGCSGSDGNSSTINADGTENRRNSRINVTDNSHLHLPHADIRLACSKGTYVRAFARDLGEALHSGAHLDALRRTRTGGFNVSTALTIDQAIALFANT